MKNNTKNGNNATKTNEIIDLNSLLKVITEIQIKNERYDNILKSNASTKYVGVRNFTINNFDKKKSTCYCNTTVANALINAKLISENDITFNRHCTDKTDYKVDLVTNQKTDEIRPHVFTIENSFDTLKKLLTVGLNALASVNQ